MRPPAAAMAPSSTAPYGTSPGVIFARRPFNHRSSHIARLPDEVCFAVVAVSFTSYGLREPATTTLHERYKPFCPPRTAARGLGGGCADLDDWRRQDRRRQSRRQ